MTSENTPHLSPRPDAVVEPVWLHAGRMVEPHTGEPRAGSLYIQPGTKAVEADCATCGDAVVRQERRATPATPAPVPVDDREALVSAWDEGRAFGDPYQRRGVPDPADNPYRAGYVKGGR